MPPRKTATESDTPAAEPRRSGRISALPSSSVEKEPVKAAKKAANSKKRAVAEEEEEGEDDGEGSKAAAKTTKKAKKDADTEEDKDDKPEVQLINIGDSLPQMTLKNETGEDVEVSSLAAEKGVILFLIPKADTPGCTTQACAFRDSHVDFTSSGYDVYCLSADTPEAQKKWQGKKELPYALLSDPKRTLIAALGAGTTKTTRSHFVFEKGGKLIGKECPVKAGDSSKLALEFIKGL